MPSFDGGTTECCECGVEIPDDYDKDKNAQMCSECSDHYRKDGDVRR